MLGSFSEVSRDSTKVTKNDSSAGKRFLEKTVINVISPQSY